MPEQDANYRGFITRDALKIGIMHKLESITDQIRQNFDARTAARDQALAQARQLTRACSLAIRAVHRDEDDVMNEHLAEARKLAESLKGGLADYPDLFYAGYTQDALKEFVEANVTCALIQNRPLLTPEELGCIRCHLPERPG